MQIFTVSGLRIVDRLIPRANPLCHYNARLEARGYHTPRARARVRVIAIAGTAKDEGRVILLCQRRDSSTSAVCGRGKKRRGGGGSKKGRGRRTIPAEHERVAALIKANRVTRD